MCLSLPRSIKLPFKKIIPPLHPKTREIFVLLLLVCLIYLHRRKFLALLFPFHHHIALAPKIIPLYQNEGNSSAPRPYCSHFTIRSHSLKKSLHCTKAKVILYLHEASTSHLDAIYHRTITLRRINGLPAAPSSRYMTLHCVSLKRYLSMSINVC